MAARQWVTLEERVRQLRERSGGSFWRMHSMPLTNFDELVLTYLNEKGNKPFTLYDRMSVVGERMNDDSFARKLRMSEKSGVLESSMITTYTRALQKRDIKQYWATEYAKQLYTEYFGYVW